MMAKMIPESIRMKLKKRLEESCMSEDDKRKIVERIRRRLRAKLDEVNNSDDSGSRLIDRIRRKIEERLRGQRDRSELRQKLLERLRARMRSRLEENNSGDRLVDRIRERINRRMRLKKMVENRESILKLRKRLRERLERKDSIIERIRKRVRARRELEEGIRSPGRFRKLFGVDNDGKDTETILGEIERPRRSGRRIGEGKVDRRLEVYGAVIRKLKRESERRKAMLREAYKVIKRVEELGGIDKIEESLKLAHDTIVRTGSKMFKEAVDKLSAETGVKKEEAAKILRRLGLKEAKEVLKKGAKKVKDNKPEVVPVNGLVKEDEGDSPVIAKRLAERLARVNEMPGIGNMKEMTEVMFNKK